MARQTSKSRIYDHFVNGITSGALSPGDRLPTEKQISEKFDVSRTTVQGVMSRLVHEGLVERFQRRGTFVRAPDVRNDVRVDLDIHNIQSFESEIAVAGKNVAYKLVELSRSPCDERIAAHLGIEAGREVTSLYRTRFISGKCIGSERRFFSPHVALEFELSALDREGVHMIIERDMGIVIGRIDAALLAQTATDEDAQVMGVDPGAPLLVRCHSLFDTKGDMILYGESRYLEPFSFRYTATVRG